MCLGLALWNGRDPILKKRAFVTDGTRPGSEFPLGATVTATGTNFAVASGGADGMLLCLFDETRIPSGTATPACGTSSCPAPGRARPTATGPRVRTIRPGRALSSG